MVAGEDADGPLADEDLGTVADLADLEDRTALTLYLGAVQREARVVAEGVARRRLLVLGPFAEAVDDLP